jgi:hypothetical protein
MSTTLLATLGILSAIVNTVGLVPYIRDILRHKTKPERATWWIWLALNSIAFFALIDAGATWGLMMVGANILAIGIVAFLSLNFGYGKFQRKDIISLVIAMFGKLNFTQLLYPFYIMLGNWLLVWTIIHRRKKLA